MPESGERKSADATGRGSWARRGQQAVRSLLMFLAAVLLLNAAFGDRGLLALLKARESFAETEQALERLKQANARLREKARRLRHDSSAIEELARRDLGLLRPGETLFIIRDPQPPKK